MKASLFFLYLIYLFLQSSVYYYCCCSLIHFDILFQVHPWQFAKYYIIKSRLIFCLYKEKGPFIFLFTLLILSPYLLTKLKWISSLISLNLSTNEKMTSVSSLGRSSPGLNGLLLFLFN